MDVEGNSDASDVTEAIKSEEIQNVTLISTENDITANIENVSPSSVLQELVPSHPDSGEPDDQDGITEANDQQERKIESILESCVASDVSVQVINPTESEGAENTTLSENDDKKGEAPAAQDECERNGDVAVYPQQDDEDSSRYIATDSDREIISASLVAAEEAIGEEKDSEAFVSTDQQLDAQLQHLENDADIVPIHTSDDSDQLEADSSANITSVLEEVSTLSSPPEQELEGTHQADVTLDPQTEMALHGVEDVINEVDVVTMGTNLGEHDLTDTNSVTEVTQDDMYPAPSEVSDSFPTRDNYACGEALEPESHLVAKDNKTGDKVICSLPLLDSNSKSIVAPISPSSKQPPRINQSQQLQSSVALPSLSISNSLSDSISISCLPNIQNSKSSHFPAAATSHRNRLVQMGVPLPPTKPKRPRQPMDDTSIHSHTHPSLCPHCRNSLNLSTSLVLAKTHIPIQPQPGFRLSNPDGKVGLELAPLVALGWLKNLGHTPVPHQHRQILHNHNNHRHHQNQNQNHHNPPHKLTKPELFDLPNYISTSSSNAETYNSPSGPTTYPSSCAWPAPPSKLLQQQHTHVHKKEFLESHDDRHHNAEACCGPRGGWDDPMVGLRMHGKENGVLDRRQCLRDWVKAVEGSADGLPVMGISARERKTGGNVRFGGEIRFGGGGGKEKGV
jgi:hypothetical protein